MMYDVTNRQMEAFEYQTLPNGHMGQRKRYTTAHGTRVEAKLRQQKGSGLILRANRLDCHCSDNISFQAACKRFSQLLRASRLKWEFQTGKS